jgi:hypothetical protein
MFKKLNSLIIFQLKKYNGIYLDFNKITKISYSLSFVFNY